MTNCGPLGWVTDKERGYRYQATHPVTGKPWPPIPKMLHDLWQELADYRFPPEACLVNYYAGEAKMGLHQDKDEEDFAAPVLSVSLGDTGIFRVGGIDRESFSADGIALDVLTEPEELDLVKALLDFPALVAGAAAALEPHRVTNYLLETARLAHLWYHKHHVLDQPEEITRARLLLARATQIVLRNGLSLLGITAPDRM